MVQPVPLQRFPQDSQSRNGAGLEEETLGPGGLDLTEMSSATIQALTNAELTPIIRQGHRDLFGEEMSDQDVKESLEAIRAGHWVPGLPTRGGGGKDPASLGL